MLKRTVAIIGIILLMIFGLRGWLFRTTVHYQKISERPSFHQIDENVLSIIDQQRNSKTLNQINPILKIAKKITNKTLSFSTGNVSENPNQIVKTGKANCVGYAALFASISNQLIQENNLGKKFEVLHVVGQLDFLGYDLHQINNDPFFANHDYCEVKNKVSGESFYIDPTVSDYFWIDRINGN